MLLNVWMCGLVIYPQERSCWEEVKVNVESQDSQSDRGDVVQAHLEQLGAQHQQAQMGRPRSPAHPETSLTGSSNTTSTMADVTNQTDRAEQALFKDVFTPNSLINSV